MKVKVNVFLKKILENEFYTYRNWWEEEERQLVITSCDELGFKELAEKLTKDLKF